jgi:hypothetical protein
MTEIIVTDHALIRYLERALGLDLNTARWAIEHAVREAAEAGASSVRVGGLTYMLQGNKVTTIIDGARRNMAPNAERPEARP